MNVVLGNGGQYGGESRRDLIREGIDIFLKSVQVGSGISTILVLATHEI